MKKYLEFNLAKYYRCLYVMSDILNYNYKAMKATAKNLENEILKYLTYNGKKKVVTLTHSGTYYDDDLNVCYVYSSSYESYSHVLDDHLSKVYYILVSISMKSIINRISLVAKLLILKKYRKELRLYYDDDLFFWYIFPEFKYLDEYSIDKRLKNMLKSDMFGTGISEERYED